MKTSKASELSEYLRENYPVNKASISQRKMRYGVGVNDSDYLTQPRIGDGQLRCPIYVAWVGILSRCYDKNKKEYNSAYNDVAVCDNWLTFSSFRKWFIDSYTDDYELDKDLLFIGNKLYSPNTCIYVPQWLNNFTMDVKARRGQYKIGVSWDNNKEKFIARCSNPLTKKQENIGRFNTEAEAHCAWLTKKLEHALNLKSEMDAIDLRIYPNVIEIIKSK